MQWISAQSGFTELWKKETHNLTVGFNPAVFLYKNACTFFVQALNIRMTDLKDQMD